MHSPALCGAPRGADAAVLRAMACFAAFIALLFIAIPVQADEIEPEPFSEAAPEPEPEPEPEPVVAVEEEGVSEPSWIPGRCPFRD